MPREKTPFTPPPGLKPAALDKPSAAWYVGLSESTVERGVREQWFPAPRELSKGRAGYLTAELDEWLATRPVSSLLPPPNTGARKGRRGAGESPTSAPVSPASQGAHQGA